MRDQPEVHMSEAHRANGLHHKLAPMRRLKRSLGLHSSLVLLAIVAAGVQQPASAFQLPDLDDLADAGKVYANAVWDKVSGLFKTREQALVKATGHNIAEVVKSADVTLVAFTAPWCKHCQRLMPVLRRAAAELQRDAQQADLIHLSARGDDLVHDAARGRAIIAEVDVTQHLNRELVESAGVSRFPTIKVFGPRFPQHGWEYTGGRTAEELQRLAHLLLGPAVVKVETQDELLTLRSRFPTLVLGVFPHDTSPAAARQHFDNTAATLRHKYRFALVTDPALVQECKLHPTWCADPEAVLLFKPYDAGVSVYQGDLDEQGLAQWLEQHSLPQVVEFTGNVYGTAQKEAMGSTLPRVMVITDQKQLDASRKAVQDAASHLEGYRFMLADASAKWLLDYCGVASKQLPALVILADGHKYMRGKVDPESHLAEWIREYEEGALTPHYRSEEHAPKLKPPVFGVTANTFGEAVLRSKAPVLLEIYRPSCPACKRFEGEYRLAAARLAQGGVRVVAGAMSTAANDIPDPRFAVTQVPTVFLMADGQVEKYAGPLNAENLEKWVKAYLHGAHDAMAAHAAGEYQQQQQQTEEEKDEL